MIFVSIASYRDPECQRTVEDLFRKARYPDQINVGVILQAEASDEHLFFHHDRTRVVWVEASETQGACWARSVAQLLWSGEEFVLQIDSHMRFAQEWDVRMLVQLAQCRSVKPLLTTYPPAYIKPGDVLPEQTVVLAAERFGPDGHLTQIGHIHHGVVTPKPTALISANFLFGSAAWITDVPYDPHLYFSGEETTLAARLWTHGWDMFGPTEALVWHLYDRAGRRLHWDDDPGWHIRNHRAMARMRYLLAGDSAPPDALVEIERYGMGTQRSLAAYGDFSGIDYSARSISAAALVGAW